MTFFLASILASAGNLACFWIILQAELELANRVFSLNLDSMLRINALSRRRGAIQLLLHSNMLKFLNYDLELHVVLREVAIPVKLVDVVFFKDFDAIILEAEHGEILQLFVQSVEAEVFFNEVSEMLLVVEIKVGILLLGGGFVD